MDLKPKVDVLKPFDRVLVRNCKSENWRANLFGYIDKDGFYCCVWANLAYCIPYIGNESLVGTTIIHGVTEISKEDYEAYNERIAKINKKEG